MVVSHFYQQEPNIENVLAIQRPQLVSDWLTTGTQLVFLQLSTASASLKFGIRPPGSDAGDGWEGIRSLPFVPGGLIPNFEEADAVPKKHELGPCTMSCRHSKI